MIHDWYQWQNWTVSQRIKKIERARTCNLLIHASSQLDEELDFSELIQKSTDSKAMWRRHESFRKRCFEQKLKPILLIIDPFDVWLDPEAIRIDPDDIVMQSTNFDDLLLSNNQWTLRFTKPPRSCNGKMIAYRPKLISFLFWIESLSKLHGIGFEIVLFSNRMDEMSMMHHLNLIQIYYNVIVRCRNPRNSWFKYNFDDWFMFSGGIATNQTTKTFKGIPFGIQYDLRFADGIHQHFMHRFDDDPQTLTAFIHSKIMDLYW